MPATLASSRALEAVSPLKKSTSQQSTAVSTAALSGPSESVSSGSVFSNGRSQISFYSNASEVSAVSMSKAKRRVRLMNLFNKCMPATASMCLGAKSKKNQRTKLGRMWYMKGGFF